MKTHSQSEYKKILFVSSPGGHFVQMSLLASNFENKVVVSTYDECPSFLKSNKYYKIQDFSRDNLYIIFNVFKSACKIYRDEKPFLVVTTGAAPGLVFVIIAKICGIKALWLDSVANSRKLSLSGKIATFFGIDVLTQWPELDDGKRVKFKGRVL